MQLFINTSREFRVGSLYLVGMSQRTDHVKEDGVVVQEALPKLKQPPLYKVIILNDDYTPMDFVVDVLQKFFMLNLERATQVMLQVHTRGAGVCGVFTRDVAETKVDQVTRYARENHHPLMCTMETA